MLYLEQSEENKKAYHQMLASTGALSNLFSDNESPYLVSRNVENIFCESFKADNLGRADCSADASLNDIGIGIKTFLHQNGRTLQKIAEFNKDSGLYRGKTPKEIIVTISELRNERINFTKRTYGLREMIYHCVTRLPGKILLFESPMDLVDIENIKNIRVSSNRNNIAFDDNLNEYSFNITKSTLSKRFITENPLTVINVEVLENPYYELAKLLRQESSIVNTPLAINPFENKEYVILPLFSDRGAKRHVPSKSGLNQWNAAGRKRNPDEVYIPIPSWIHRTYKGFFPNRDQSFSLHLPDHSTLSAKVCQENSKALMTNPNSDLGEWLLRQVMNLKEGELLTYEQLENLGIDSVRVYKLDDHKYAIDFCEIGSYDDFVNI